MKNATVYLMAVGYIAAGIMHLLFPRGYLRIMPAWVPAPLMAVYASGVIEILFALLLLPVATRAVAAWLIIVMLVAIFPANIQMVINFRDQHSRYLWLAIARLPLQLVLIWWAWYYTRTIK